MDESVKEEIKRIPLSVDIVSDVVCPWCIVGYKQFEKALATKPGQFDLSVHWQPFELNPQMPPEGQNLREHLAEKAGITPQQSQAARERLTAMGESLGFEFGFSDDMRVANTFRAHQLLHWAGETNESGQQTALKLALFGAYFTRGQNISDVDVLVAAAVQAGLPESEAREVLKDERYAKAVRTGEKLWLDRDIRGVPAFIFNQRYSVMGAQDADSFIRVLDKLAA